RSSVAITAGITFCELFFGRFGPAGLLGLAGTGLVVLAEYQARDCLPEHKRVISPPAAALAPPPASIDVEKAAAADEHYPYPAPLPPEAIAAHAAAIRRWRTRRNRGV